jgi:hypothetical protein
VAAVKQKRNIIAKVFANLFADPLSHLVVLALAGHGLVDEVAAEWTLLV